jgi:hypothetical protein
VEIQYETKDTRYSFGGGFGRVIIDSVNSQLKTENPQSTKIIPIKQLIEKNKFKFWWEQELASDIFINLYMTRDELLKEIHIKIDNLPEKHLQGVLDYINELAQRAKRREFVEEIIEEDHEVFKRLAE